MAKRVAVVTGANKGIGYAIVRGLCKQFDGDVLLTARSESNGHDAVKKLNGEGLNPTFHQLDVDLASIDRIETFLQSTYGGIDVLVNNAGIYFEKDGEVPFSLQAEKTVATNFRGALDVCKKLFPLLRPHARVVNVSSRSGHLAAKECSETLLNRFLDPKLDMTEVEQMMTEFVSAAKDGTYKEKGWPDAAYGSSKIGMTLMSFVQQNEVNNDPREDIFVNVCCPGYVDTDMSSHKGTKTIDEGADTPLYLSLLPPDVTSPKGEFVAVREVIGFPHYLGKV